MDMNLSCPHGDRYRGGVIFYVNHMSGGAGFVERDLSSFPIFRAPRWYRMVLACVSNRTLIIMVLYLQVMPRFSARKTCLVLT